MSQTRWDLIKQTKRFYVKTYRQLETFLIISALANLSMACYMYHVYFNQGEPSFYSTDGVRPPLTLIAMDLPNNSPIPILKSDPIEDATTKVMMP